MSPDGVWLHQYHMSGLGFVRFGYLGEGLDVFLHVFVLFFSDSDSHLSGCRCVFAGRVYDICFEVILCDILFHPIDHSLLP